MEEKEIYDIVVKLIMRVEAESREEAESIARDWAGIAEGAPDNIEFISADID